MSKDVEISRIVIKIGKKEIKLSLKEARELQAVLDETLGAKEAFIIPTYPVVERIVERPRCPPYHVIPIWQYIPNLWTVSVGTSSNAMDLATNVDSLGTVTYTLSDGSA